MARQGIGDTGETCDRYDVAAEASISIGIESWPSTGDVLRLVEQLAQPNTSKAYLVHAGRPRVTSSVTGRAKADHGLVIAVHDGRGYAEYSDNHHHCQTLGNPGSGEWHTTHQGHFLPGSGIPVDQLAVMVIEFLNTAELPESVQWRDLTRHGRQARRAVS